MDIVDVKLSVASVERDIVLWEHVPGLNMDDFATDDAVVEKVVVVCRQGSRVCSRGSSGFERNRGARGWSDKQLWTMELQSIPP